MAGTDILSLPIAIGLDGQEWVPLVQGVGIDAVTKRAKTSQIATLDLDGLGNVQGDILFRGATQWEALAPGTSGYVLSTQGPAADPIWVPNTAGSVVSVGLDLPASLFSVSGSPVTSTGTLTGSLINQSANMVFAGPASGPDAVPTFRALVNADISATGQALTKVDDTNVTLTLGGSPSNSLVNAASLTLGWTGTLAVSRGGLGVGTLTQHGVLLGQNTSAVTATAVGATGSVLAGNTGADPTFQTISAILDNLGATQGNVLYRGSSGWVVLAPGTNGQVLSSGGPAANPSWATLTGTGTVTSVNVSGGTTGLTFSGGPITTSGTITMSGTLIVADGGTGRTTLTNHGILVGAGTTAITQLAAAAAGTLLSGQGTGSDPAFTATPTLGIAGTTQGSLAIAGVTSGAVTVAVQAAAGTYNFNLPTSAGSAGQPLLSGGGAGAAMSFGTLGIAAGGTGVTTGAVVKIVAQIFTSSGTYTPTAGMLYCYVYMVGGGASGGGCAASAAAGNYGAAAGGSAGEYAEGVFSAATIGASQTVTIGAGGAAPAAGQNNGNSGGTTSLGALLTAVGGTGGQASPTGATSSGNTGAAGGTGGTGTGLHVPGGASSPGLWIAASTLAWAGNGGTSFFGGGGSGGIATAFGIPLPIAGAAYGSGGGGAANGNSAAAKAGAAGANGVVVILEYCNQ